MHLARKLVMATNLDIKKWNGIQETIWRCEECTVENKRMACNIRQQTECPIATGQAHAHWCSTATYHQRSDESRCQEAERKIRTIICEPSS